MLEALPGEVWTSVFVFLTAPEVVQVGSTCILLNKLSESEGVWKQLCIRLWHGKATMPFAYKGAKETLFPSMVLKKDYVRSLSVGMLKFLISSKGIDPRSLFFNEKKEYVCKVMDLYCHSINGISQSFHSVWKSSYYYSLLESKRRLITHTELTSYDWTLVIKRQEDSFRYIGNQDDIDYKYQGSIIKFHNSGLCEGIIGNSRVEYPYHVIPKNGNVVVAVGPYPPLSVFRHKGCWKWILENQQVLIFSDHYECD